MTIRPATEQDTETIVALLKLSLGDVSTTKSATYWRWKHLENPFGESYVLLAEEGEVLVGIRAFMQWRWTDGKREYKALRAVDTATHPDHRGKGIFKKLTLELIEQRRAAGDDFIFNTPNDQSRPGYLKMGWQIVGRLPVALSVRRPLRMLINRASGRAAGDDPYFPASKRTELWTGWEGLRPGTNGSWRTADRPGYLQWRYGDCPVASYLVTGEPGKFLVVVHPKATAFGTEFRVVEERIAAGQEPAAKLALAALVRKHRPVLVSAASTTALSGFSWFRRPLGPVLTYRELNHSAPPTLDQWAYSLGDMELF